MEPYFMELFCTESGISKARLWAKRRGEQEVALVLEVIYQDERGS